MRTKYILYLLILLILITPVSSTQLIISVSGDVIKRVCINQSYSDLKQLLDNNLNTTWASDGRLCEIHGIGSCNSPVRSWILYLHQNNEFTLSPVGFTGTTCYNQDQGDHICPKKEDTFLLNYGEFNEDLNIYVPEKCTEYTERVVVPERDYYDLILLIILIVALVTILLILRRAIRH